MSALTDNERSIKFGVARALWINETSGNRPASAEKRRAAWEAAKPEFLREAAALVRRLQKEGIELSIVS